MRIFFKRRRRKKKGKKGKGYKLPIVLTDNKSTGSLITHSNDFISYEGSFLTISLTYCSFLETTFLD